MTIQSKALTAASERFAAKLMDLVKPAQRSVDAIRRVAALPYAPDTGIAMTGVVGMGTPAYAAAASAPTSITINMPIHTGEIYDGDGFAHALREHRAELYEAIDRELAKRDRTQL